MLTILTLLADSSRVAGTNFDLKSLILFIFVLGVLGVLAWLAWSKAPQPINWIIVFILAAAAIIVGYRFLEQM